jgi:aerobic-type carbon monoxide dehydrogenase small subunit (CoxS/CutS family)
MANPTYSCCMLAVEAEGREVTTIEGIGTPDRMNEVQKAFVKHDAQQCGFCTPDLSPRPRRSCARIQRRVSSKFRAGLGGNLCRCGTYAGMILAVSDAANGKGGSNA